MLILLLNFVPNFTVEHNSFLRWSPINDSHLDPNEWADILAASGAKYDHHISVQIPIIFVSFLDTLFSQAKLVDP